MDNIRGVFLVTLLCACFTDLIGMNAEIDAKKAKSRMENNCPVAILEGKYDDAVQLFKESLRCTEYSPEERVFSIILNGLISANFVDRTGWYDDGGLTSTGREKLLSLNNDSFIDVFQAIKEFTDKKPVFTEGEIYDFFRKRMEVKNSLCDHTHAHRSEDNVSGTSSEEHHGKSYGSHGHSRGNSGDGHVSDWQSPESQSMEMESPNHHSQNYHKHQVHDPVSGTFSEEQGDKNRIISRKPCSGATRAEKRKIEKHQKKTEQLIKVLQENRMKKIGEKQMQEEQV